MNTQNKIQPISILKMNKFNLFKITKYIASMFYVCYHIHITKYNFGGLIMISLEERNKTNKDILEKYNSIYEDRAIDIEDVLDFLSEEFNEKLAKTKDAQMAYDLLAKEHDELLNNTEWCFGYELEEYGRPVVITGEGYKKTDDEKYISLAKKAYKDENIKNIDDIIYRISKDIWNTTINGGCDDFSALELILRENFTELYKKDVFIIDGDNSEGRITIVY